MLQEGQSVEVYTMILRGMSQNSYPGVVVSVGERGFLLKTAAGVTFFSWMTVERVMVKGG